jgi:yeast amino acid transporter
LKICDDALSTNYPYYQRHSSAYKPYTFFGWFQPWVAWIGLTGCILVFVFSSATWWSTPASFTKVAVAYGAVGVSLLIVSSMASLADSKSQHIILFVLFVIFKIISRKWWVKLDPDVAVLVRELDRLRWLKQDEVDTTRPDSG